MVYKNEFILDTKEKNSLSSLKRLKFFIERLAKKKSFDVLLVKINYLTGVDKETLSLKLKKLILNQFYYKENSFKNEFSILKVLFQLFLFLGIFIKFFFSKRNSQNGFSDIILANVDHIDEIEKFKKVLNNYKSSIILTKKKFNFEKGEIFFQDEYLKNNLKVKYENNKLNLSYKDKEESYSINTKIVYEKDVNFKQKIIKSNWYFLYFGVEIFINSFKFKVNLLKYFNLITYSIIRNFSIFDQFKGTFLIQDRIYGTCPIRNYFFKKGGGYKTACIQSHLSEGTINLFNDIDIFFSFGAERNSIKYLNEMGSRVSHSFPVGSLKMESYLNNSSKNYFIEENIDILIFGVNVYSWLYLNEQTKDNYYKFFEYIKDLSNKNKKLNFFFKHHPNNKDDSLEQSIMKNSNVKYVNKVISSYRLLKNCKLFLSFSSTMILETCGTLGKSLFIDPNNNNDVFFQRNDHLDKIRITSKDDLEKIINEISISSNSQYDKKYQDVCLESRNTSELINEGLKTITI